MPKKTRRAGRKTQLRRIVARFFRKTTYTLSPRPSSPQPSTSSYNPVVQDYPTNNFIQWPEKLIEIDIPQPSAPTTGTNSRDPRIRVIECTQWPIILPTIELTEANLSRVYPATYHPQDPRGAIYLGRRQEQLNQPNYPRLAPPDEVDSEASTTDLIEYTRQHEE